MDKQADTMVLNKAALMQMLINTTSTTYTLRRETLQRLLFSTRDIDNECGYPPSMSTTDYKTMYDRLGLANRIVKLWPDESWSIPPNIYETEDDKETSFEKELTELFERLPIFNFLYRIDVLSGIAEFGLLLFGLDDGKELNTPAPGFTDDKQLSAPGKKKSKLLYLRAFDQSVINIKTTETEKTNPRYGLPKMYTIDFENAVGGSTTKVQQQVHWSRVLHVADNRMTSEVFGTPRLKDVYNNLLDVKKISGGSGEMFWKGGFPGYALETIPERTSSLTTEEKTEMKDELESYMNSLKRYVALQGINVKPLQPQVADPRGHLEWHVKLIAMTKGVPWRLLLGTEQAKLASSQDKKTWNARIKKRQNNYLTPMMIRPFVERLQAYGALSLVPFMVDWEDLDAPSDEDKAKVALTRTEAFAKFVQGDVESLMTPRSYLSTVHGMTTDEINAIEKDKEKFDKENNGDLDNEQTPPEDVDIEAEEEVET